MVRAIDPEEALISVSGSQVIKGGWSGWDVCLRSNCAGLLTLLTDAYRVYSRKMILGA